MGAARHTQRHQEQAHRRVTRSEPPTPPALPPLLELCDGYETWDAYVASLRGRAERGWFHAAEAEWLAALPDIVVERDRLRAALDGLRQACERSKTRTDDAGSFAESLLRLHITPALGGER